ncbi:Uncharacterized protein dnl_00250 [Desulfonema limicola]|uniref:Uncharacterized protein n=1 Tax=Desulfonema limicola TaxID=45656 RepID=A0A975B2Y7_9BACT|nr:Uncharacterized protein dnl_00250 [Desulfonema limicola]
MPKYNLLCKYPCPAEIILGNTAIQVLCRIVSVKIHDTCNILNHFSVFTGECF